MQNRRSTNLLTGVSTSPAVSPLYGKGNWAASLQVVANGTVTYNIEVSNNKVDWHVHTSALTGSTMVNISSLGPVGFIRLRITAGTGTIRGFLNEVSL